MIYLSLFITALVWVGSIDAFTGNQNLGWMPIRVLQSTCQRSSIKSQRDDGDPIGRLSTESISPSPPEEKAGNVFIPSSGISVSDEMEASQQDRFATELVPIKNFHGIAQLITSPIETGSFEPVRYLVSLSPPTNDTVTDYVMIDIPPFSPQLVARIRSYIGRNGKLRSILVTSRNAIHYDDAPGIFTLRRADLDNWKKAFPGLDIVAYRLDIPRDCRHAVTQVLDGYGPFALDETDSSNWTFIETGRPLTYMEWDHNVAQEVLNNGKTPPDDDDDYMSNNNNTVTTDDDIQYTPESIRRREEGKRIIALYTPGHSYGSMSYVFPNQKVCCSGYTIPVEDNRNEENLGTGNPGPAFDCRGYITTSAESKRQFKSAEILINTYIDRFHTVLASRGDPLQFDIDDINTRKEFFLCNIEQYKKIAEIYSQLGIVSDDDDDYDDDGI